MDKDKLFTITQIAILILVLFAIAFTIGMAIGFERTSRPDPTEFPYLNFYDICLSQYEAPLKMPVFQVLGVITAYNPTEEQCGANPEIMASGKKVYRGAMACPRWLEFGTLVGVDDELYVCEDRLHPDYEGRFDILMWNSEEALEWGVKQLKVEIYE